MLKVIVVSAYGDMPNIRSAMNRGAFDFVTKPMVKEAFWARKL
jgi:FixJ family two-component response regulator